MTDKSIFVYKLLLSLNISDFSLFFYVKTGTPWKIHLSLSQQPPLKIEILSSPPFWKFSSRLNPPAEMGMHYDLSNQCYTKDMTSYKHLALYTWICTWKGTRNLIIVPKMSCNAEYWKLAKLMWMVQKYKQMQSIYNLMHGLEQVPTVIFVHLWYKFHFNKNWIFVAI